MFASVLRQAEPIFEVEKIREQAGFLLFPIKEKDFVPTGTPSKGYHCTKTPAHEFQYLAI